MTLEQVASLSEAISSIFILTSLVVVALQLRQSELLNRAKARHDISVFAMEVSKFQAEHADRFARVYAGADLTPGDLHFRNWSHMQLFLHAETFFRHYQLGLMPTAHWRGYAHFIRGYFSTPGFRDAWHGSRQAFSNDFAAWMDEQSLAETAGAALTSSDGERLARP